MTQLDSSLFGGFQPIQVPDQTNMLLKAIQAQGLMSQNRLAGLQADQVQKSSDATDRINTSIAAHPEWMSDPDAMRTGLFGAGGTYAAPVLKSLLDSRTAQANLDKLNNEIDNQHISRIASDVGAAAANGPDAVIQAIQNAKYLPAARQKQMLDGFTSVIGYPDKFAGAVKQIQTMGLTAEQQIGRNDPTLMQTEQGIVAVKKDGSNGSLVPAAGSPGNSGTAPPSQTINQPFVGRQPAGNFSGDPSTVYAGLQHITDPNDRAGAIRAFQNQLAGANPTPDASGVFQGTGATAPVSINGGQSQQGQSSASALGAKPSGTWEVDPLTGQRVYAPKYANPGDVLNPQGTGGSLSAPDQAIAEKIAAYEMAPPSLAGMKNPRIANIMASVADQHPEYDATQYATKQAALKQFTPSGKAGMTIRSLSVASDHLDTLASAADAMKNGNLPLVNQVANFFGTQTGNTSQGAFNAVKNIVGDEVVKAVVGSAGGVSDREELKKSLNDAQTPQQLADVIRRYRELMGAQKSALQADYENSTGKTDFATRFNYKKSGGAAPPSQAGWSIEKVN